DSGGQSTKIDLLKKIGISKIAFALEDKIEVARVFRSHGVLTLMVSEYENALLHQQ
ncbi:TPA: 3'-phosphatase, partial [Escherichia coli]